MADSGLVLVFTYIIPALMAFGGIILMVRGVMDNKNFNTVVGVIAFLGAALLPFIILPSIIGS